MDFSRHLALRQAKPSMAHRPKAAVLMLLLAACLWGSGNVANKTVLNDLDPFAVAIARNSVAFLVLLPFMFRDLATVSNLAVWFKSATPPSVLFAIAIIVQQWGYQSASVTNASFLVNTASVLTPLIAFVWLRERLHPCIGAAAALTAVGAFLMSGAGKSLGAMNVGDIACLVSALFYAAWTVALTQHSRKHGKPFATTCLHCAVAVVFSAAIWVPFAPEQPGTFQGALPEVLYLGLFSTAIAFALTAAAQAHMSASGCAVLLAAESLFGAAGAMLLLGERPGQLPLLGAALMLIAILIVARSQTGPALNPTRFAAP